MRVLVKVEEIKNLRLKYKNRYVDLYALCDTFESVEVALSKKGLSGIMYRGANGLEPYKGRFGTKVYHCIDGGYDEEFGYIYVSTVEYPDKSSTFRLLEGVCPLIMLDASFDRFDLLESYIANSGINYQFMGCKYAGFIGSKYVALLSDSEKTPLSVVSEKDWIVGYDELEEDKIEWTNGVSAKTAVMSKSKKGEKVGSGGEEYQKSTQKKVKKSKPVFGATLRSSGVEF